MNAATAPDSVMSAVSVVSKINLLRIDNDENAERRFVIKSTYPR